MPKNRDRKEYLTREEFSLLAFLKRRYEYRKQKLEKQEEDAEKSDAT